MMEDVRPAHATSAADVESSPAMAWIGASS